MILTQALTILILALIVFVISFFWLKKEDMDGRVIATRIGAFLYGLIFGTFIGLVMVPLRLQMLEGGVDMSDNDMLMRYVPAFTFFILVIRSDVTGRLPVIGTYVRAYRAAMLRRTISGANKRLDKIAALEARAESV